jgi:hypothetical protein
MNMGGDKGYAKEIYTSFFDGDIVGGDASDSGDNGISPDAAASSTPLSLANDNPVLLLQAA